MAKKKKRDENVTGSGGVTRPSLADAYPTIARWASGYGWVEFGIDGLDRPFVRALDEGGTVWEGEARYGTLDEALGDLEDGLARFMEEQGFIEETIPTALLRSPKVNDNPRSRERGAVTPVMKKVEKLGEIAAALRRGEDFSITRLTILKGLCEDRRAAGEFALFLARKAREKLRGSQAPDRHKRLVDRAVGEMRTHLDAPAEERKDELYALLREMQAEQEEHKNIAWGSVRLIKSGDLLVAEKCLRAVLRAGEPRTGSTRRPGTTASATTPDTVRG